MDVPTIDLRELQKVTNRLFDHVIQARGVTTIELRSDFYWQVPNNTLFDMASPPAELDVGRLSDDWDFVRVYLDEARQPVAYSMTELAPLIHYVGFVLGEQLAAKGG